MKVILTGSSGLVGRALSPALLRAGDQVQHLVRTPAVNGSDCFCWDPVEKRINPKAFEDADVVVHLAGENIASGRWTVAQKSRILDSRVVGTCLISETIAKLPRPPKALICASAIGYYGNRRDEVLCEDSESGRGFLAEVCREWECATAPARTRSIRVVNLRFGMILSRQGGALAKMLAPFRLGLGGVVGNGRQYWSWVTLNDVVRAIQFVMANAAIQGAVNVVSLRPVTNREFTRALGAVLHRPTIFPMPAVVARALLGEMAEELLLASARVLPKRLKAAGFTFEHANIETALPAVLEQVKES